MLKILPFLFQQVILSLEISFMLMFKTSNLMTILITVGENHQNIIHHTDHH